MFHCNLSHLADDRPTLHPGVEDPYRYPPSRVRCSSTTLSSQPREQNPNTSLPWNPIAQASRLDIPDRYAVACISVRGKTCSGLVTAGETSNPNSRDVASAHSMKVCLSRTRWSFETTTLVDSRGVSK